MSTSGALNPETEARPVLTQSETDRARQYGHVRQVQLGEILYRPGQVGVQCFVLLSANLEIVQPTISIFMPACSKIPFLRFGTGSGIAMTRLNAKSR